MEAEEKLGTLQWTHPVVGGFREQQGIFVGCFFLIDSTNLVEIGISKNHSLVIFGMKQEVLDFQFL